MPDYQLKFVVSEPQDLHEIQTLIASIGGDVPPHRIQIMPEGTSPDLLLQRQKDWVDICKSHGYRLNHRLHVDLFGNSRGT
jgi:7-carboxy-7-deazaguanine synthase